MRPSDSALRHLPGRRIRKTAAAAGAAGGIPAAACRENPPINILSKNVEKVLNNKCGFMMPEKVLYFNAVMMYNESKAEIQRRISY